MKGHGNKLIAPIVITALVVLYFIWIIAGSVIPLCLAGVMIYVLAQRVKEIRSGEEDDLSQY